MSEESKTTVPAVLSKKEKRIAHARQLIKDWEEEEKPEDIVSGLGYRAHLVEVLEALGFTDAHGHLVDAVDKRRGAGLEPLDVLPLAFAGKLLTAIDKSKEEIADQTEANADDARRATLKEKQSGGPKNGPVTRQRRQSMS